MTRSPCSRMSTSANITNIPSNTRDFQAGGVFDGLHQISRRLTPRRKQLQEPSKCRSASPRQKLLRARSQDRPLRRARRRDFRTLRLLRKWPTFFSTWPRQPEPDPDRRPGFFFLFTLSCQSYLIPPPADGRAAAAACPLGRFRRSCRRPVESLRGLPGACSTLPPGYGDPPLPGASAGSAGPQAAPYDPVAGLGENARFPSAYHRGGIRTDLPRW